MIRQREALPSILAAVGLVILPLPFGGVTPWAQTASLVGAFLLLALALAWTPRLAPLAKVVAPATALALIALLGWGQSWPLPAALVHIVSPEHARLFAEASSFTGRAQGSLALSLAPATSRDTALLFLAAAACLLAGALIGRERRGRRLCSLAFVAGALIQWMIGLADFVAGRSMIWGVTVASAPGRMHGTFVNPNHFATYLGMALPCLFAWAWWSARRASLAGMAAGGRQRRWFLVAPPLALWILLFAGLTMSASRAAMLAALFAVALQGALLAYDYRRWRLAFGGFAVAVVGLGAGLWLGMNRGLHRLVEINPFDVSMGSRLHAWRATVALWRRFPWLGSGLGTFRDGFPLVQPRTLGREWWHAHSDYLELLATVGVVGALVVVWGGAMLVRRLWRNFRHGERSEDRAVALAALGVLAATGIHEALDFGLTMPANALSLALLCGLASGVATQDGDRGDAPRRE